MKMLIGGRQANNRQGVSCLGVSTFFLLPFGALLPQWALHPHALLTDPTCHPVTVERGNKGRTVLALSSAQCVAIKKHTNKFSRSKEDACTTILSLY